MRSLFAITLALAAGCGDNLQGPPDPTDDNGAPEEGVGTADPVERIVPQACGAASWDVAYEPKDTELRIAGTKTTAAVFMVPKGGGWLRGFQVDGRGFMVGDPGVKIRTDATYTGLAAARLNDRFVVSLVGPAGVSVNMVSDDLGQYRELAQVAGASLVGDGSVMHMRDGRVAVTGGAAGMEIAQLDGAWAATGTSVVAPSVATAMTSAEYGDDAMVAWSTPDECHLRRVGAQIESMQAHPCANPRIAVDYARRGGWMVYEAGEKVMLARITVDAHDQIGSEQLLHMYATSPRIVFDGERYWVSYLDARGDLVVGALDDTGTLHSMALDGTRPMHDAYDLGMAAGAPWAFALDDTGVSATRFCLRP